MGRKTLLKRGRTSSTQIQLALLLKKYLKKSNQLGQTIKIHVKYRFKLMSLCNQLDCLRVKTCQFCLRRRIGHREGLLVRFDRQITLISNKCSSEWVCMVLVFKTRMGRMMMIKMRSMVAPVEVQKKQLQIPTLKSKILWVWQQKQPIVALSSFHQPLIQD